MCSGPVADPPEVIAAVRGTRYASVARLYGRVTVHGTTYLYHKPSDALIRQDRYPAFKEALKHVRTPDSREGQRPAG